MMLSLDTAYRSFGGEVEASNTPTICRLPDSRRHQLSAIALGALRKVLSQQAIGVLVRPALPRALRIAKIYLNVSRQRKTAMIRKFLSPVPGQRLIQLPW